MSSRVTIVNLILPAAWYKVRWPGPILDDEGDYVWENVREKNDNFVFKLLVELKEHIDEHE